MARELRPLHIAWQLGFLHQHGVTLQGPAGYDMEVTNDMLSAFQRQDSPAGPAEPARELSKKMTLYLAEVIGCCFGDRPLKPKSLDAAVTRVDGLLVMQPVTKLGLLCGGRATAKHKRAYNRLTMLLNTGAVPTSQRVTSPLRQTQTTAAHKGCLCPVRRGDKLPAAPKQGCTCQPVCGICICCSHWHRQPGWDPLQGCMAALQRQ